MTDNIQEVISRLKKTPSLREEAVKNIKETQQQFIHQKDKKIHRKNFFNSKKLCDWINLNDIKLITITDSFIGYTLFFQWKRN